jgi:hypothetical protein
VKVLEEELRAGGLEIALTRAGFQAQRLSVWLLQVLPAHPPNIVPPQLFITHEGSHDIQQCPLLPGCTKL